jgi:hypothetical protein
MAGEEDENKDQVQELLKEIDDRVDKRVKSQIEDMEIRLGQKLEEVAREIGKSIQPMANAAVTASLPQIVEQVGQQFKTKLEERAGNPSNNPDNGVEAERSGGFDRLLRQATMKDIVELISAFKQPSSGQELSAIFGTFLKGWTLGQKAQNVGNITREDLQDAFSFGSPQTQK